MKIQYTMEMGEAAEKYLYKCNRFAHPLPQQFRWEKCFNEMLSAAPTPPDLVEPVYQFKYDNEENWREVEKSTFELIAAKPHVERRILYTSPPSPKASWDADGNPLNLEAAARDIIYGWDATRTGMKQRVDNLRKFLPEVK